MKMRVLVVDDEPVNLDFLNEALIDHGYETVLAQDGEEGWEQLNQNQGISAILLDRMMPRLNGIDFLKRLKSHHKFNDIPVIMQTVISDQDSITQGIEAGAYYYLAKPFKQPLLLSILRSAIEEKRQLNDIKSEISGSKRSLGMLQNGSFNIRTIQEAQNLSYFLAASFPEPESAALGLTEIMINAIEHGNLDLGFDRKSKLMIEGGIEEELARRLALEENQDKFALVEIFRDHNSVSVTITDQGEGFDWEDYMHMQPHRASNPNGRGIIIAKTMSFDRLEYHGKGNKVSCIVDLN